MSTYRVQTAWYCRNCGKPDLVARGKVAAIFWEPDLCMECHYLPAIGRHYDAMTGKPLRYDEWKTEIVTMSHEQFVDFMTWVWSDKE